MGSMDTQSILTVRMNRPIIGGSSLLAGPDWLAGDSRARGSHKPVFLSRVDLTEADRAELDGVPRAIYVTGGGGGGGGYSPPQLPRQSRSTR